MITTFRNFFQSKIGMAATLAFVVLIGIAFASMDVSSSNFGGISGGGNVVVVGDEKIDSVDLSRTVTNNYERVRERNPTLSMQGFLANDGMDQSVDDLIDRSAIAEFARKYGLRAGDNLVNSEIQRIGGFRGPDGNFSDEVYQNALRQNGMNDASFRADATKGLLAQQLLTPVSLGARVPDALARRYAGLFKETRSGGIALIPSAAFMPEGDPTEAQLKAFYDENRDDFIRPERRVIRFASFGTEALSDNIEPTAAEIAARYEENKDQYAASESRTITQLIVPTEAAANAIRTAVNSGKSLEDAAREAGLSTTTQANVSSAALQQSASASVASAVFATPRGQIAVPARGNLGWHVVRVDSVSAIAARSLAQASGEISTAIREEKRRKAINDLAARIEEEVDEGVALSELAQSLDVELQTTRPVLATGLVYETTDQTAPEILAPVLANAFEMLEGEPQMSEVVRGETFLIYEVTEITQSATAPLSEIGEQATMAWKMKEGSKAAKLATDRILAKVADGTTLAAAIQAEEEQLPGAQSVNLSREQLMVQYQQSAPPPPLALLFSMAQDTAKPLEMPQDAGWYVVSLDSITAGSIADDDPILAGITQQLGQAMGQEYVDQLRGAMRDEIGVERNETAIEAVAKQLRGEL